MIHRYMNENEKEKSWETLDNIMEECPDIASPDIMEDCGNDKLNEIRKYNE